MQTHAARRERRHDAVRRGEPVDRPAGERDGMRTADEVLGRQRFGLAHAGAAAADIDARRPVGAAQHDRHAGLRTRILGLPHRETRDVGDEIPGAGAQHART
jgi:hypothetical protein